MSILRGNRARGNDTAGRAKAGKRELAATATYCIADACSRISTRTSSSTVKKLLTGASIAEVAPDELRRSQHDQVSAVVDARCYLEVEIGRNSVNRHGSG